MNETEFAAKIKEKYPSYANVPDSELVSRVVAKYPQYKSQLDTTQPSMLKSAVQDIGNVVGGAAQGLNTLLNPITRQEAVNQAAVGVVNSARNGTLVKDTLATAKSFFEPTAQRFVDATQGQVVPIATKGIAGIPEAVKNIPGSLKTVASKPASYLTDYMMATNSVPGLKTASKVMGKGQEWLNSLKVAPFAKQVDTNAVNAAGRLGVNLPASAMSNSKVVPMLESIAAKGTGGVAVVDRMSEAAQKLVNSADDMVRKSGGTTDASIAGQQISDHINTIKDQWQEIKNKLYDEAILPKSSEKVTIDSQPVTKSSNILDAKGNPQTYTVNTPIKTTTKELQIPVDAVNARDAIKPILEKAEAAERIMPGSTKLNFWKGLDESLSKPVEAYDLKETLKELNRKAKFGGPEVPVGYQSELRKLGASISKDLDTAIGASNPELQAKIDLADQVFKKGLDTLNSGWAKNIRSLADQNKYDKIASNLFNKNTSADQFESIIKVLREQDINNIKSLTLKDILSKAKNPATGLFYPQKLANEISRWEDKLNIIFSPDEMSKLKDINTVAQSLGKTGKIMEGSQTSWISNVMGLVMSPVKMVTKGVVSHNYGKFIGSQTGQNLLTKGIKFGDMVKPAIKAAAEPSQANRFLSMMAAYQASKKK